MYQNKLSKVYKRLTSTLTEDEKCLYLIRNYDIDSLKKVCQSDKDNYEYKYILDKINKWESTNLIEEMTYIKSIADRLSRAKWALEMYDLYYNDKKRFDMKINKYQRRLIYTTLRVIAPDKAINYKNSIDEECKNLEKEKLKQLQLKCDYYVYQIKNICNGIRTGKLFDGSDFNLLAFWQNIPFKNINTIDKEYIELFPFFKRCGSDIYKYDKAYRDDVFFSKLHMFAIYCCKEEAETLSNYMIEQNIKKPIPLYEFDVINSYEGLRYIIDEDHYIEVEGKDIKMILSIMKTNNYPLIKQVFKLLLDNYMNYLINNNGLNKEIITRSKTL